MLHVGAAEGDEERGALVHLGFGPDPAAVPQRDALHERQARPFALELVAPVQPLEQAEQLPGVAPS